MHRGYREQQRRVAMQSRAGAGPGIWSGAGPGIWSGAGPGIRSSAGPGIRSSPGPGIRSSSSPRIWSGSDPGIRPSPGPGISALKLLISLVCAHRRTRSPVFSPAAAEFGAGTRFAGGGKGFEPTVPAERGMLSEQQRLRPGNVSNRICFREGPRVRILFPLAASQQRTVPAVGFDRA
jgi:hypothetical protein